jgi:hypothetical protein
MKFKHYLMAIIFGGLCTTIFFSGCSNNDDAEPEEVVDDDDEEGLMSDVDNLTYNVVNTICKIDSVDGIEVLRVAYGKALNSVTPTSLYYAVKDQAAAYDFFYSTLIHASDETSQFLSGDESNMICNLGDNGTITYRKSDQPGELAVITFNLPRLKDVITTLTLIPTQAWPENDESSKFGRGDIIREDVDGQSYYWICIREYGGGVDGILLTVDYGWEKKSLSDHYKSFEAFSKCAREDAWDALAAWWFDSNADFRQEYETLKDKKKKGTNLGWILDIFSRTIDGSTKGNEQYQYNDTKCNKYYWAAKIRNVWEATNYYVRLGMRDGTSSKFQKDYYYFKRNNSPCAPNNRNSHSRYFGYEYDERGNNLQRYYRIIYSPTGVYQ